MRKHGKSGLAEFVSRVVRDKGLKLCDVARNSDGQIAQSYVSRIMTGDVNNISLDKLVALARGIGEDPHRVFTAYYGSWPRSATNRQEDFECGAVEFVEVMRKVARDSRLTEIVKEATRLWPEEYPVVLGYVRQLNEHKRRSKWKKLSVDKATT
jgi:transcriptional regulator with XRE-family HTH domain